MKNKGTNTLRVVRHAVVLTVILVMAMLATGCLSDPSNIERTWDTVPANVTVPAEFKDGEKLYNDNCRRCHGPRGAGTTDGPPLVHITYEPSHHGDDAFLLAPKTGVRAHHWDHGNMPKVPTVNDDDVQEITDYIRFLQREVGID